MSYKGQPAVLSAFILLVSLVSLVIAETAHSQNANELEIINIERPIGPVRPASNFDLLFGWPKRLSGNVFLWQRAVSIIDIDNNQDCELAMVSTDGWVHVYQHDGANYPGYPLPPFSGNRPQPWENASHRGTTAVGDVNGNNMTNLVYVADIGYLHVWNEETSQVNGYPLDLGRNWKFGIPALAELDEQSGLEIVLNLIPSHIDSLNASAYIYTLNKMGRQIDGFPVRYPRGSHSTAVVGDILGNGLNHIVIGNSRYGDQYAQIHAWSNTGERLEGFPVGSFETINCTPSLALINEDNALDIVFWAKDATNGNTGIYAYNGNGELLNHFPLDCPIGLPTSSPAIVDIIGDEVPNIVFLTQDENQNATIYAWNSSDGSLLENFPFSLNKRPIGTAIVADVSGDRIPDIVFTVSADNGNTGEIYAIDYQGEVVEGFPLTLAAYGGGVFISSPTVYDVNLDGKNDICALTTDRRFFIWNTDGYSTDNVWSTEKGNMARTGVAQVHHLNIKNNDSETLLPSSIHANVYPNPFNSYTEFSVSLPFPDNLNLNIYDVQGRLVKNINVGNAVNHHQITISADEIGITSGIYLLKWQTSTHHGIERLLYLP